MERNEDQFHYVGKGARLFTVPIFFLMFTSLFLHLCGFGDFFFRKFNNQSDIRKNESERIDDLFNENLLPFFCIFAHLIWTIVPIVVLDQCCLSNKISIGSMICKLFLCTCPILLCSELSLIFICHVKFLIIHFLFITMKWFIFLATILIAFWTGIISDKDKWRGIHGGQIAPEVHSPLYRLENEILLFS